MGLEGGRSTVAVVLAGAVRNDACIGGIFFF